MYTIFINASNSNSADRCRDTFNSIFEYHDSKQIFIICSLFNNQEDHYQLIDQFPNIKFIISDLNDIELPNENDDSMISFYNQKLIEKFNKIIFSMNLINYASYGNYLFSLSSDFICSGLLPNFIWNDDLNIIYPNSENEGLISFSKTTKFAKFWDVPFIDKDIFILLSQIKRNQKLFFNRIFFRKNNLNIFDYLNLVHYLKNKNIKLDINNKNSINQLKSISNEYSTLNEVFKIRFIELSDFQILKNKFE